MKIGQNNKLIPNTLHKKFLGFTIDSTLSWRIHIDQLTTKLSTACIVTRFIKPYVSHKSLQLTYYSLFCTVLSYGIIFGGNSYHSTRIFRMQKRGIRIIMACEDSALAHLGT